jgi:cellulose biosynthesis protein BcsQ
MDLDLDDTKKRTRRLGQLLDTVADDYDIAFLDCPPSISLVSENVLHASDMLLVPLIPATLSLRTLDQLTRFVADSEGSRPELVAFDQRSAGVNLQSTEPFAAKVRPKSDAVKVVTCWLIPSSSVAE